MEKYIFTYAVDSMTTDGEQATFGMILDHEELREIVGDIIGGGSVIIGIFVSMYDDHGHEVGTRDITSMFARGD